MHLVYIAGPAGHIMLFVYHYSSPAGHVMLFVYHFAWSWVRSPPREVVGSIPTVVFLPGIEPVTFLPEQHNIVVRRAHPEGSASFELLTSWGVLRVNNSRGT